MYSMIKIKVTLRTLILRNMDPQILSVSYFPTTSTLSYHTILQNRHSNTSVYGT